MGFEKLYQYRFEFFLATQLFILFGSLFVSYTMFENWINPLFLLSNLITGLILISKKKWLTFILMLLLLPTFVIISLNFFNLETTNTYNYIRLISSFSFYLIVTLEIIKQVWKAELVSKNVILGLISGYISLGFVAFFICLMIEIVSPNSFVLFGNTNTLLIEKTELIMYYSFVTLMTIGYGDVLPVTHLAQKASIFIGLVGQFYMVILTAIVVGKYINQNSK